MEKPINTLFRKNVATTETPMEKTTRIAMKILEEEAEERTDQIALLRKARLEREAKTAAEAGVRTPKKRAPKGP